MAIQYVTFGIHTCDKCGQHNRSQEIFSTRPSLSGVTDEVLAGLDCTTTICAPCLLAEEQVESAWVPVPVPPLPLGYYLSDEDVFGETVDDETTFLNFLPVPQD